LALGLAVGQPRHGAHVAPTRVLNVRVAQSLNSGTGSNVAPPLRKPRGLPKWRSSLSAEVQMLENKGFQD
jgi:hypothetical protein